MSPKDAYFARLDAKLMELGAEQYLMVRGIDVDSDEDEDEDSDGEDKEMDLTKEQCDQLRHLVMTPNRVEEYDEMEREVLGDQAGCSFTMHSTSFSYHVIDVIQTVTSQRIKCVKARLDRLLGLTIVLNENPTWCYDNEGGDPMVQARKQLGSAWKKLLAMKDAEVGLDAEFTRPGIVVLCDSLQARAPMPSSQETSFRTGALAA